MKLSLKRLMLYVMGLSLLITVFLAPMAHATNDAEVDIRYVSITDLTESQKAAIKQGLPQETIDADQAHFLLVYQPLKQTTTSLTSTDTGSSGHTSHQRVLPKTNGVEQMAVVVMGLLLLGLTGYVFYRYRRLGWYLLLIAFIFGGHSLIVIAQEDGRQLGDVVTTSVPKGSVFDYAAEAVVSEEEYVGYIFVQENLQPTTSPISSTSSSSSASSSATPSSTSTAPSSSSVVAVGSVYIEYKLADGTILRPTYVDTRRATVGTAYNTAENENEKPLEITVNGKTYSYKETQGEEIGTVVEGNITVSYIYEQKPKETINVRIRVIDKETGTVLKEMNQSYYNDYQVSLAAVLGGPIGEWRKFENSYYNEFLIPKGEMVRISDMTEDQIRDLVRPIIEKQAGTTHPADKVEKSIENKLITFRARKTQYDSIYLYRNFFLYANGDPADLPNQKFVASDDPDTKLIYEYQGQTVPPHNFTVRGDFASGDNSIDFYVYHTEQRAPFIKFPTIWDTP